MRRIAASPVEVRNEIAIPVPVERVWDLLSNVGEWPSWWRACRWVRVEAMSDDERPLSFHWKAHPLVLQSTVMASERPYRFVITANGLGVRARRAFTLRRTPDGLRTVIVSHETQDGWLPWLGRVVLAPRLHGVNQAMFADLARAAVLASSTQATAAAR